MINCLKIFKSYDSFSCNVKQQASDANKSPKSQYLEPPQPQRQFLISPPGSPPDGWEPVKERAPAINYDLIAAITNLAPGRLTTKICAIIHMWCNATRC